MRHFRTTTIALGLAVSIHMGGCTAEIGDAGDSDIVSDEPTRQQIDMARVAIYEGRDVGTGSIVTSVNQVLSENLLSPTFADGTVMEAPAPPADDACPFLEIEAGDTELDCRFIVERARDLAYADMGPALDQGPVSPELEGAPDPAYLQFWYQRGAFSGVDGEVVRAVAELRRLGACDTAPTPAQNSEMAGYELGRALFLDRLEAQVAVTPETVCDFDTGIIDPALDAATAAVETRIAEQPLCGDFSPTDPAVVLDFDRAKLAYELGVRAGIRDQAVISAQDLLETWTCTPPVPEGGGGGDGGGGGAGDPLVVDLRGDGVAPLALGRVGFDLTGTGMVERVAWPQGDDALLALDVDGNGVIDSGRELFSNYMVGPGGARFGTGFEALAVHDRAAMGGDGSGAIDPGDAVYDRLLVWLDHNADGVSQPEELTGLRALGIESLAFDADDLGRVRNGAGLMTERAGNLTEVWLDLRF